MIEMHTPLTDDVIERLHAGDHATISGVIYAARDAAHKRIAAALERGEPPPFDLRGAVIYYTGPTPARPGNPIGSAGPTTSGRMDPFTPALLRAGLKGMIGKGSRSPAVRAALREYKAVYCAATGGAGALIARSIRRSEVIGYPELGPESVLRLEVQGFEVIVVNDIYGGDAYEAGRARYRRD